MLQIENSLNSEKITIIKAMNFNNLTKALNSIKDAQILFNEPLANWTTFKLGGTAQAIVFPKNIKALKKTLEIIKNENIPYFILGNGSNVLALDEGFPGLIINMQQYTSPPEIQENLITINSGNTLNSLLPICSSKGLSGLEFCAGLPASAGGAVLTNAGAWGQSFSKVVQQVTILNPELKEIVFTKEQLICEYRKPIIPEPGIVTEMCLQLESNSPEKVKHKISEILSLRKKTQPIESRSAGCIFKNPKNYSAGKLIADCGLAGFTFNGAKISEKHANFIVNEGFAKSSDVLFLIEKIQNTVLKETGISLELEIQILKSGNPLQKANL